MYVVYLIVAAAFLFTLVQVLRKLIPAYSKWSGIMMVTCPESMSAAGVEVDAKYAALTSLGVKQNLTLKSCTRWPERQNCGQDCLTQVESSPEDCLVKNILQNWFEGQSCSYCQGSFGKIHWHDHKPAFVGPGGDFVEWSTLPVEKLPEILESHKPVCWNCLIAENFRRQYPDLVTDRPSKVGEEHL